MKSYKKFNIGDEVYTKKSNWRSITADRVYIVLDYYKPIELIESSPVRCISVKNDHGFISRYATDKFYKTESQIRQDKIDEVFK